MNIHNCADIETAELNADFGRRGPHFPGLCAQTHVHECEGSVFFYDCGRKCHNHRFATVTTEEIPVGPSHKHTFCVNTDFNGHHHELAGETGLAVYVCNGKHVHYAEGLTTLTDCHAHEYQFATLLDDPYTWHRAP